MQEQHTVAYLGPEASYTHQAVQALLLHLSPSATLLPHATIPSVFTSVHSGATTIGLVPFENSTNGPVSFTLGLLADLNHAHPSVRVCGKTSVRVRHCLLGHRNKHSAPPPTNDAGEDEGLFKSIKTLYSHPQAWGQCERFLQRYLPHARREDATSTARAAELVAADPEGGSAAVSSEKVAAICGLDVLARDIQDRDDNITFFLLLAREERVSEVERLWHAAFGGEGQWKSTITFTVPHSQSGVLADVLLVFKERGVNMVNMHQCPRNPGDEKHVFCAELDGKRGDELLDEALKQLGKVVEWRWLGNWMEWAGYKHKEAK